MRKCKRWHDSEVDVKKMLMKLMKVAVSVDNEGHNLKVIHHFRKQCGDSKLPMHVKKPKQPKAWVQAVLRR